MQTDRRDFVKTAGTAALTASIFTGNLKGANDRVSAAFIGMGRMGRSNLSMAMKQENLTPVAVCDVYQPHLEQAVEMTKGQAKGIKDFREILADKSIDVVCISTPDHWHPYMMVEACKAGKDVYVEKPICVTVEEGKKMVEAARKYKRVVQAGTQQRSGAHFQKAVELVKSGHIGEVTFVRTWNYSNSKPEGIGNPPDSEPPSDLDWDMWLGPAPKRPFNKNRFGVDPKAFSHFRWFWDYAGGMMTDWGVHLLDIVQMAYDEAMPKSVVALGNKFRLEDNRETPDTLQVTYEYPGFIATYENRYGNANSMFGKGYGILFHGDIGTLFVDRRGYEIVYEGESAPEPVIVKAESSQNMAHWANFLDCVKTRQKPNSDIENCQRSTTTCLLGNVALRSRLHIDWDEQKWTTKQSDARKWLSRDERKPWKLTV
ncbi:MAG: Gfo/Idh/MocA family protein [Bryobacteraceae bacterium]